MVLHGYRYQWKDENADAEKQLGLLAQEVQKVLPELVKEGENGKLGVNYSGLIPVLLEALKAEQSRNDLQQAMIALQQARFEKQQAEIEALKEILKRVKK
ncbi:MAG: tail fiber domain-containing protein [Chitinophagaceae bacterium]|nr:tail fiber domain-containing protein [Chitinophagaceae bacterium]